MGIMIEVVAGAALLLTFAFILYLVLKYANRSKVAPFVVNIADAVQKNSAWREVVHTADNLQTVIMSIPPGEELSWEVHFESDQLFKIESGFGELQLRNIGTYELKPATLAVVPKNTYHNVVNTSKEPLKLYTIYAPPHHPARTIDYTHADEIKRERS